VTVTCCSKYIKSKTTSGRHLAQAQKRTSAHLISCLVSTHIPIAYMSGY